MPFASAAAIMSRRKVASSVIAGLIAVAMATASALHADSVIDADQSPRRDASRPDGDAERKLVADLDQVHAEPPTISTSSDSTRKCPRLFAHTGWISTGWPPRRRRLDSRAGDRRPRSSPRSTTGATCAGGNWGPGRGGHWPRWCARRIKTRGERRLASCSSGRRRMRSWPCGARAAEIKALKRQPARSLVLLVRLLWEAGDPGTATPVLNVAEQRFPDDFWVCIELGNLQMVDAPVPDPVEAARYFARAAALHPRSYAAHANLANTLVDLALYDHAVAEFRTSIRLNPKNADTFHDLGETLLLQAKTAEAIAALEQAIKLKPDLHEAHFALGVALGSRGRRDAAVAAFRKAIALKPDLAEVQDQIRIEQGKDGALAAFREAIRNPGQPAGGERNVVVKLAQNEKPAIGPADRGLTAPGSIRKRAATSTGASPGSAITTSTRRSANSTKRSAWSRACRLRTSIAVLPGRANGNTRRQLPITTRLSRSTRKTRPPTTIAPGCGQPARSPPTATGTRRFNRRSGRVRFRDGNSIDRSARSRRLMPSRAISALP